MHELPESRFYMWRAVFAMAHVDGQVSVEERGFADKYLEKAHLSDQQKSILKEDLQTPKKIGEMLKGVTNIDDQADFFQFSHMLALKDGETIKNEQNLIQKLSEVNVAQSSPEQMKQKMREARKAAVLRRAIEDDDFSAQAQDVSGFANVLRHIVLWMDSKSSEAPDNDMFNLWRAVLSLVHADGELADEEREYIYAIVQVFHFSASQKNIIEQDLKEAPDTVQLFELLKNVRHRKQFFVLARTIIWCDGIFHEQEKAMIEKIVEKLGDKVSVYENELRWIDRKPDIISADTECDDDEKNAQDEMMQNVVRQMLAFYREGTDEAESY